MRVSVTSVHKCSFRESCQCARSVGCVNPPCQCVHPLRQAAAPVCKFRSLRESAASVCESCANPPSSARLQLCTDPCVRVRIPSFHCADRFLTFGVPHINKARIIQFTLGSGDFDGALAPRGYEVAVLEGSWGSYKYGYDPKKG